METPKEPSPTVSWLGIAGATSCYLAMFPFSLVGILGWLGVSAAGLLPALNAYMASSLFNPILALSLIFLVIGTIPAGRVATLAAIGAGAAIFISMNVYMRAWLFLIAFLSLAAVYVWASFRTISEPRGRRAFVLAVSILVVAGILGFGTYLSRPQSAAPPLESPPPAMMPMF